MRAWIARRMIGRAIARLNAGDPGPILRNYSRDAVLVFPGSHSWGARYQGKDDIGRFFRRAVSVRLQFEITDVVVAGPPCQRLTIPWDWMEPPDRGTALAVAGVEGYEGDEATDFERLRTGMDLLGRFKTNYASCQ